MKILDLLVHSLPILVLSIIAYHIGLILLTNQREGFTGGNKAAYDALKARLSSEMATYCELSSFVQAQMKQMYMSPKIDEADIQNQLAAKSARDKARRDRGEPYDDSTPSSNTSAGETEQEALAHIQRTYQDVYACKDDLASSRPICALMKVNKQANEPNKGVVPCEVYTNLPDYSDTDAAAMALNKIPDSIAERIMKEVAWYSAIIKKLSDAIQMGKSPPSAPPDSENSPSKDKNGVEYRPKKKEGFFAGPTCSPSAAQALRERKRKEALQKGFNGSADDPDSCQMPDVDGEVARVNGLLNSSAMKNALGQCASLKSAMLKLQADIKAVKDQWGDAGSKKSYSSFKGGDRVAGLTASMQQNQ